jgi:hypothetical protein
MYNYFTTQWLGSDFIAFFHGLTNEWRIVNAVKERSTTLEFAWNYSEKQWNT